MRRFLVIALAGAALLFVGDRYVWAGGYGGGSGGSASCSGDLNAGCSQVLSTHIARRVAIDASDQLVYTLDEAAAAGTFVNTGALSTTGDLTGNSPGTKWQSGYTGMFLGSVFFQNPATNSTQIASAVTSSFAEYNVITLSGWVMPTYALATSGLVIDKMYQNSNTLWPAVPEAVSLLLTSSGVNGFFTVSCRVAVAAANKILNSTATVSIGSWHHVGCTYDGVNQKAYIDGADVASVAQAGNVDYGSHGAWEVGGLQTSAASAGMTGFIDDVRVANVARDLAYFQNVWKTGMQIGGN